MHVLKAFITGLNIFDIIWKKVMRKPTSTRTSELFQRKINQWLHFKDNIPNLFFPSYSSCLSPQGSLDTIA